MKKNNGRFRSIWNKFVVYGVTMIVTCVVSLLAVSVLNQAYSKKLLDILDVHKYFSVYYTRLDESDEALYRFASSNDAERETYAQKCTAAAAEFMEVAGTLKDTAKDPVTEDFYWLADTYIETVHKALGQGGEEGNSAARSESYQNTVKIKDMIRGGYSRLWDAVDAYSEEHTALARQWQRKMFALVLSCVILVIVFCTVYNLNFFQTLIRTLLSLTATARSEIALIENGKDSFSSESAQRVSLTEPAGVRDAKNKDMEWEPGKRLDTDKMANDETMILAISLYQLLDDEKKRIELLRENAVLQERLQQEQYQDMRMKAQLHQARLQQIQSLVNPHFLFNTLAGITDLSIRENAPETEDAIEKLSVFLRYSLAYLSSTVTVLQEIDSLRNYFDIQRIRFKNRYHFEIEWETECGSYHIPAVVLQPLAENALHHGVGSYTDGGRILCRIFREQGELIIEMADNGVGMTEQQTEECYKKMQQGLEGDIGSHIGLTLTYYRLQDFAGWKCRCKIDSSPGQGTKIQFGIPLTVYGEHEEKEAAGKIEVIEEATGSGNEGAGKKGKSSL